MTDQPLFADPMPAGPMAGAVQQLQRLVLDVPDVESFLSELAGLAPTVLQPAASCGINVYRGGRPLPAVSSDERAAELDETQYQLDEGPCLEALLTGQPVYVADAAGDPRWPDYMELARDRGLRSSFSLPLTVDQETVGAMNLFVFHAAEAFDPAEQERCLLFAAQASAALQVTTRLIETGAVRQQLEQALASRITINQALGILMTRHQCDADQAFGLLRSESQNSKRRLRDIAADLVATARWGQLSGATPVDGPDSGR